MFRLTLARRAFLAGVDGAWCVYLVRCVDGTLYCGVSNDVSRRVAAHNAGRGARYTAGRAPVTLLWSEEQSTRGAALRREAAVKRLTRAQKLALAQKK